MLLNIILATTNIVGAIAIYNYCIKFQYINALCIFISVSSSFVYHLIEIIKHNMPGVGVLTNIHTQKLLLNIDRIGALLATVVTVKEMYYKNISISSILNIGIYAVIGLVVPEILSGLYSAGSHQSVIPPLIKTWINPQGYKINETIEHIIYVVGHSIWHINVFRIANIVSEKRF